MIKEGWLDLDGVKELETQATLMILMSVRTRSNTKAQTLHPTPLTLHMGVPL